VLGYHGIRQEEEEAAAVFAAVRILRHGVHDGVPEIAQRGLAPSCE